MPDQSTPPKHHKYGPLGTIVTALISGFVAIQIARINAEGEFKKASLGYEKIAQSVNELEKHSANQDKNIAEMNGHLAELNQILQFNFTSQAGIRKNVYPPTPGIPLYGGEYGDDRPPRRYPISREETVPPPRKAAKEAIKRLKKLENNVLPPTKITPLTPLPPKL